MQTKNYLIFVLIGLIILLFAMVTNGFTGLFVGTEKSEEKEILKWGLIPADDAQEMLREYETVADYLGKKLNMKIELTVTDDYTAAIEAMRAKHIDMAWFGPLSYVLANDVADAEAIVNGIRSDTGKSTYKSVIITRADSGIETLDDLKGKSFAFVDPASTSGNLMPRKIFADNGIDPDEDFSLTYYAGTHNAVQLAVANGKVDAGADSDNSYYRMVDEGQIDPEVNVIIYESEPIPGSPIVVRGDLPEDLKKKIQDTLIGMDEQTIHKIGGWGKISKYVTVEDKDYDVIRDMVEILGLDLSKQS
jgi:phosphonate transport system substrate-binding protein